MPVPVTTPDDQLRQNPACVSVGNAGTRFIRDWAEDLEDPDFEGPDSNASGTVSRLLAAMEREKAGECEYMLSEQNVHDLLEAVETSASGARRYEAGLQVLEMGVSLCDAVVGGGLTQFEELCGQIESQYSPRDRVPPVLTTTTTIVTYALSYEEAVSLLRDPITAFIVADPKDRDVTTLAQAVSTSLAAGVPDTPLAKPPYVSEIATLRALLQRIVEAANEDSNTERGDPSDQAIATTSAVLSLLRSEPAFPPSSRTARSAWATCPATSRLAGLMWHGMSRTATGPAWTAPETSSTTTLATLPPLRFRFAHPTSDSSRQVAASGSGTTRYC